MLRLVSLKDGTKVEVSDIDVGGYCTTDLLWHARLMDPESPNLPAVIRDEAEVVVLTGNGQVPGIFRIQVIDA